jgi:hypothetical protein|eukprot:SAG25_NODE_1242_length_3516_cov_1.903131_4_plen_108_part_00
MHFFTIGWKVSMSTLICRFSVHMEPQTGMWMGRRVGISIYALAYHPQTVVCLLWQVLFAFIPPTDFCGGWATFFVSLVFIGGVTAVVGAFARACSWPFVRQASRFFC